MLKREETATVRLENIEDQMREMRDAEDKVNAELDELRGEKIELQSRLSDLQSDKKSWEEERADFMKRIESLKAEQKDAAKKEASGDKFSDEVMSKNVERRHFLILMARPSCRIES